MRVYRVENYSIWYSAMRYIRSPSNRLLGFLGIYNIIYQASPPPRPDAQQPRSQSPDCLATFGISNMTPRLYVPRYSLTFDLAEDQAETARDCF